MIKQLKVIFVFLFLIVNNSYSQERTNKEITLILKKGEGIKEKILYEEPFQFNKISLKKAVSLKNKVKGIELNAIEMALLANFDDVILSAAFPKGYFVTQNKKIGFYDFNGNLIVPPTNGYPRLVAGTGVIYFGDTMPCSGWGLYIKNALGKARRAYAGDFIVVIDKETLIPRIPFASYEGIHFTMNGVNTVYYVNKMVNDKMKWGVIDKHGNVLVPCEYNFVGLEKNKYYGDNTKVMDEEMAALNKILRRRQANSGHELEKTLKAICNVAKSIGKGIIDLNDFMVENGIYDAINSYAGSSGASLRNAGVTGITSVSSYSSSKQSSIINDNDANVRWMQNNYQSQKMVYGNYESQLSKMKANYPNNYNDSQRTDIQRKMKRVREIIVEHGGTCNVSPMESWKP